MDRDRGISVRLKLTLSYAGFLMLAGTLLLIAVWLFLLRGRPNDLFLPDTSDFLRALDPRNFGPRVFVPAALMVMGFLLIFGLAGGWVLAGRMLAPLTRITAATRTTTTGSLAHRIDLEGRQDEFHELPDASDAMLARLDGQVAEQQRFAANASHELRTPLATTQTMLEVAAAEPDRDPAELINRLRIVNTRAIQLIEDLLILSTADHLPDGHELVDLSLIAEEATETLLPLAEKYGIDIYIIGHDVPTIGSSTLLRHLIVNLLHNAILYNVPDHGNVRITTSRRAACATFTIQNTGNKLAPELVSTLTEPFRRGNDRVHDDRAGAGLGLAIVKRITQAHGGTLTINASRDGGLHVLVELPDLRQLDTVR